MRPARSLGRSTPGKDISWEWREERGEMLNSWEIIINKSLMPHPDKLLLACFGLHQNYSLIWSLPWYISSCSPNYQRKVNPSPSFDLDRDNLLRWDFCQYDMQRNSRWRLSLPSFRFGEDCPWLWLYSMSTMESSFNNFIQLFLISVGVLIKHGHGEKARVSFCLFWAAAPCTDSLRNKEGMGCQKKKILHFSFMDSSWWQRRGCWGEKGWYL